MKRKLVLSILLICIPSYILCQVNNPPKLYLNGKEFRWNNTFINPNTIGSINVQKDTSNGEIFIKTKDGKWKYKSLQKFLMSLSNYKEIHDPSTFPVFIIDGTLINDPDSVRIDASYFGEAKVSKLSGVKGVPDHCKNMLIVNIKLSDKPIIHIRGNDLHDIDSLLK